MHHNSHHQFITHDETTLFYQRWAAAHQPAKKAIVLFHRGHEHSERMAHLVEELNLPDFDFCMGCARTWSITRRTWRCTKFFGLCQRYSILYATYRS